MRSSLMAVRCLVAIDASAEPPRDRTSRTARALARCRDAWTEAYSVAQLKGLPAARATRMAAVAYKLAMPEMDSLASIKASISCVAQGITMEVFDGRDGSQLLYAAQVAMSVLARKEDKRAHPPTPAKRSAA
jgi:hypothetical protein